jgi:hypothetical protein
MTGKLRHRFGIGTHRWVKRFGALAAAVALVAGGALLPATAAHAAGSEVRRQLAFGDNADGFWYFDFCTDPANHLSVIYLEGTTDYCGSGFGVLGFASVTTTALGNHWLEVCNYWTVSNYTEEIRVNVANADGSASATVLAYDDPIEQPSTGTQKCFKELKGYPMRKFRFGVVDVGIFSDWAAIPS